MARDLAIDLGTANTLVYARGEGIVLNEPSVIALNTRSGEVLAIGHEARRMIGRTPGHIVAVRPLRHGAITDFDVTERMVRLVLQRVGISRFKRPRVLICVPSAITAVERRAVKEAARRAGASESNLIDQSMAAAIGSGLPIDRPLGTMVVDVGGGTTESALISLGGVVSSESARVGSFDVDLAVQQHLRRQHGIVVGEQTAEEVKLAIGTAWPRTEDVAVEVRGRELASGVVRAVTVTSEEIRRAIDEPVSTMVDSVIECLGSAPPELSQDLIVRGIHLVGGGSLVDGLCDRVSADTNVPVQLVERPLEAVVLGAGQCVEAYDEVRYMFQEDSPWALDRPLGSEG